MKLYEVKNLTDSQITKLEKILSRRIGTKIYRWGGKDGFMRGSAFDGYLYTFHHHAFRLNYSHTEKEITTIDYWSDASTVFSKDDTPTYQLQFPKGLTLISIIGSVAKWLKRPTPKDFEAESELKEEVQLDEAARTTYEEFVAAAAGWAQSKNKKDLKFTRIELKSLSDELNVSIPSRVWVQTVPGSRPVQFSLAADAVDDPSAVSAEPGAIPHVSVVAGESAQHHVYRNSLTKADEKVINDVVDVNKLFTHLEKLIKIVLSGARNSMVVVGGAGVGKTQTIMDTIHDQGMRKGGDDGYLVVKGKISPIALYTTLFLNSNKLVIFDDTDSVWDNTDACNILKAALDSAKVRNVDWVSPMTHNVSGMEEEEKAEFISNLLLDYKADPGGKFKPPSSFEFTGRIIFISNRKIADLDPAVINRSLRIDMTLTTEQVFDRIESIMDKLKATNGFEVSIDQKKEVLDFLREQSRTGKLGYVAIRSFVGALGLVSSGDPDWRELLRYSVGE